MNCTVKKHNLLKILFIIIVLMDIRLFYMYDFNGWYELILAIITFILQLRFAQNEMDIRLSHCRFWFLLPFFPLHLCLYGAFLDMEMDLRQH